MQAILALEDGRVFRGKGYGAKGECSGEVVFNTSITGYQEIFTDPSYAGQIVVLTNPEIGNYGTNPEDNEADASLHRGADRARVFQSQLQLALAAGHRRVHGAVQDSGARRHRHARPGAPPARQRRDARRHLDPRRRHRQTCRQSASHPENGWPGSRESRLAPTTPTCGRRASARTCPTKLSE